MSNFKVLVACDFSFCHYLNDNHHSNIFCVKIKYGKNKFLKKIKQFNFKKVFKIFFAMSGNRKRRIMKRRMTVAGTRPSSPPVTEKLKKASFYKCLDDFLSSDKDYGSRGKPAIYGPNDIGPAAIFGAIRKTISPCESQRSIIGSIPTSSGYLRSKETNKSHEFFGKFSGGHGFDRSIAKDSCQQRSRNANAFGNIRNDQYATESEMECDENKIFIIGGFRLPYATNAIRNSSLPESYAVRYFKMTPDYIIRITKTKKHPTIQHIYCDGMSDEIHGNDITTARFRDNLCKEWTEMYKIRGYHSWESWWREFRYIDVDISQQLEKFDCFNVKYNFIAQRGPRDEAKLIQKATTALTKNRKDFMANMKTIHCLMDHTLLGGLSQKASVHLQDIIRSIPNKLWINKMQSMIFLWFRYNEHMKSPDMSNKGLQMVQREWKSPVIHWLAKQAFDELWKISQTEFPQYSEVYGAK